MSEGNNPMNDAEIRTGFLKIGYSSEEIRQMYLMFEEIAKGKRFLTETRRERTVLYPSDYEELC